MMHYVLVVVAALLATEVACHLAWATQFDKLRLLTAKATRVLRSSSISDHHKERVIPAYSLRLAGASATILIYILLVATPFVLAAVVSGDPIAFVEGLMAPLDIGIMLVASVVYFVLRRLVVR